MKWFKITDLCMQIVMLIVGIVAMICKVDLGFFYAYFLVGGVQLLSCLIHAFAGSKMLQAPDRRHYYRTLLWTLIIGLFVLGIELITPTGVSILYLFGLLFVSPALAIWYFIISYYELKLIRKKEFIHLK